MVYKLKIFIIPSNKKHTKLNPDGEYFKKSMIEEPKPKAKPKPEAKPSAQNSEPKKGGANEQKENSKEKPKPKAKPKPPKINLIIKKPIVKKLTYWEKTLALDFLKDTKWKNKLILQFPDDPDPHKHFKNIILKFNKEDKEKPPEYKSAEITELFQFIAKCNKEPFRLFDSQVDAMFKLIDERLKKIFKKDTKVTRKYTFKKKTKPKPKPKGKPKSKEKPKPKPPPEHEKILICGFTWK